MPAEPATSSTVQPDFVAFSTALQHALVSTTRLATSIPSPSDLKFQRSLSRPLGKKVDRVSDRLLHLTARTVELARQAHALQLAQQSTFASAAASSTLSVSLSKGKGKGKGRLQEEATSTVTSFQEEDIVDGYQRNIVDVTDQVLEKIDVCLDASRRAASSSKKNNGAPTNRPSLDTPTFSSNGTTPGAVATTTPVRSLPPGLGRSDLHMAKPQKTFSSTVDNSRTAVFKPLIAEKHHASRPLDTSAVLYYDPEMRVERLRIPNPYASEIEQAAGRPLPDLPTYIDQYTRLDEEGRMLSSMDSKPFTWVESVAGLHSMLEKLAVEPTIAIDLEHHDYRSYRGITCLMQISTARDDFLVDVLVPPVRGELHILNKVFASPDIVKVLHGAESDIIWLQRDFGLYIVNLFDTFHASQSLGRTTGHSLKSLLAEYTTFVPDKRYQLADWRLRPLPAEMMLYARSDTHFLLHVYKRLVTDPRMPLLLDNIRQKSAHTAQQAYEHILYDGETGLGNGGWRALAERHGKAGLWGLDDSINDGAGGTGWIDSRSIVALEVFKAVHNWRDLVARDLDESWRFVLTNKALFRLSDAPPSSISGLTQSLGNETVGLSAKLLDDLLAVITKAKTIGDGKAEQRKAAAKATARAVAAGAGSAHLEGSVMESITLFQQPAQREGSVNRAMQLYAMASRTSSLWPPQAASPTAAVASTLDRSPSFASILSKVHADLLDDMAQDMAVPVQANVQSDVASPEITDSNDTTAATRSGADPARVPQPSTNVLDGDHTFVRTKKMLSDGHSDSQRPEESDIIQGASGRNKKQKKRALAAGTQRDAREGDGAISTSGDDASAPAFDYSTVRSVLDVSPEEGASDSRARKKAKKANTKSEAYDASFRNAPKSMNAPKHGARSQTFTR